jgi:hypothetical protein
MSIPNIHVTRYLLDKPLTVSQDEMLQLTIDKDTHEVVAISVVKYKEPNEENSDEN